jgi:2'-5' RNA ligase
MSQNVKYEYGCIMALVDEEDSKKIIQFNKSIIPDEILYVEEGQEYGRETEPHVTVKFGFTKNYSKGGVGKLISNIDPFIIKITKIDIFSNEKFDVVKFNVESDFLRKLNTLVSKLPNEDKHPTYNPHLTLAYVRTGMGKRFIKTINPIELTITRMKYSNPVGKYYYDL